MVLLYLLFQRFYRSVALKPVNPGELNDVGPRSGAGTGYFETGVVVAVCQLHELQGSSAASSEASSVKSVGECVSIVASPADPGESTEGDHEFQTALGITH